jgi:hypothetical protein
VGPVADRVELTVSDGSADEASAGAVDRFLAGWVGGYRYVRNRPPLRLVDNMNRTIELASGDWVMQLGDDYLLPGAGVTYWRPSEALVPRRQYCCLGSISSWPWRAQPYTAIPARALP